MIIWCCYEDFEKTKMVNIIYLARFGAFVLPRMHG